MSRKRRTITEGVADVTRRKRRDLTWDLYGLTGRLSTVTGGTTGGGSTTPDGCPNIGPPEAGAVFRTSFGTGSQMGHEYTPVPLALLGLEDCTKTISYCFCARVGPSTSPSVVSCDDTLGRIHAGLIDKPLKMLSLRDWTGNDGSAYLVEKDDIYAIEMYPGTITYGPDTWPTRDSLYAQFKYQYEGTAAVTGSYVPLESYSGGVYTGRLHYAPTWSPGGECEPQWAMNQPYAAIGNSNYRVANGGGINVNLHENYFVGGGSAIADPQWRQVHTTKFYYGSSTYPGSTAAETWVSVIEYQPVVGGPDPIYTASGVTSTGLSLTIGSVSGDSTAGGLSLCPEDGVGRVWFWDIVLMEDHRVYFKGLPSGSFVVIDRASNPGNRWTSRSRIPASTAGEAVVYPVWRGEFGDASETYYPSTETFSDCPASWGSFPAHRFRLYNGDPCSTGTLIKECTVSEGFYGGDVWVYSTAGFSSTGTIPNVYSTIRLSFIAEDGSTIEAYEPTGANTVQWTRTGYPNISIPGGSVYMQFTQWKRGTGSGWGEVDDLQVNVGQACCAYSPPQWQFYVPASPGSSSEDTPLQAVGISPNDVVYNPNTGDNYAHVTRLWSEEYQAFVNADDLYEVLTEHQQGASNLLTESRDQRCTATGTGTQLGTPYADIVLSDYGISTGQTISVRLQAKVST